MTKKAFTLSEVLITVTIVGIVAIMTIPSLVQNYKTVEYSSRIKKTYSEVSNAVTEILRVNDVKKLSDVDDLEKEIKTVLKVIGSGDLSNKYGLNGESYNISVSKIFLLPDGAVFGIGDKVEGEDGNYYDLVIDSNGKKEPNTIGRDIFFFKIRDNGTIDAYSGDNDCDAANPGSGLTCSSKLIENGWEIDW